MSTIVSDFTVTTLSAVSAAGLADTIMVVAVVALLALLVLKDVASNTASRWLGVLSRGLNIAVIPLGLAFAMIAAARLMAVVN
jgi:hypothetical protein